MKLLPILIIAFGYSTALGAECTDHPSSDGLIAGYGINLREAPATTANVVKVLNLGAMIHIVERGQCATIGGKTGRWVKVDAQHHFQNPVIIAPLPAAKGWLFDAYVVYPDMFKYGYQWGRFAEWSLGGGDYIETYYFENGTFRHQTPGVDKWVNNEGFVFSFGNILMLSHSREQPRELTRHYIFKDRNGNICVTREVMEQIGSFSLSPGIDGVCDPEFLSNSYVRKR